MTPKNKKKFRKEIADGKKNSAAGIRFSRKKKFSDDDDIQKRNFSERNSSFDKGKKRPYRREETSERRDEGKRNYGKKNFREDERYDRRDKRDNVRGRSDEKRTFEEKRFPSRRKEGGYNEYRKRGDRNIDNRRNEERNFDDRKRGDRNLDERRNKRSDDRNQTERKDYRRNEERKFGDRKRGDRNLDERRNKRSDDERNQTERRGYRRNEERNFDDRKKFGRKPEGRSFKQKINFDDDRSKRFIDDESPLKKERKQTEQRKYSSYENNPGKAKKVHEREGEMRLNKYLAHCGIAARRKADEMIEGGLVKVNGEIIKEMGYKVKPGDEVRYKGKIITPEKKIYILLNKPKDFITTAEDERGRKTVMQLIEGATDERVYPVGRLDRNTTGLLLLTNDGDVAQKLSHPSHGAEKVYAVELDKPLSEHHMKKIMEGVELEDGVATVDDIAFADTKNKNVIGIMLHVGKNRIVRRIFESLGYQVERLDRTFYAGLEKKNLERGKWRFLSEKEIMMLKRLK